jgi:hypothetical protein
LCLNKMFQQDCPVCEYRARLEAAGESDKKVLSEYRAKRQMVYNVWCHDSIEEEKKGVQTWIVPHFFFESKVQAIVQDESGEKILFASPDMEGRIVAFEKKGKGQGNTEYLGHKFFERKAALPDAILNGARPLDEYIVIPEYDTVYKALNGSHGESSRSESVSEDVHTDDALATNSDNGEVSEADLRVMTRKEIKAFIADHAIDMDADDFDTVDEIVDAILIAEDSATAEGEVAGSGDEDAECPVKNGVFGETFDQLKMCGGCGFYDQCSAAHHDEMVDKQPPKAEVKTKVKVFSRR